MLPIPYPYVNTCVASYTSKPDYSGLLVTWLNNDSYNPFCTTENIQKINSLVTYNYRVGMDLKEF